MPEVGVDTGRGVGSTTTCAVHDAATPPFDPVHDQSQIGVVEVAPD